MPFLTLVDHMNITGEGSSGLKLRFAPSLLELPAKKPESNEVDQILQQSNKHGATIEIPEVCHS
jgi:hypothetical protein